MKYRSSVALTDLINSIVCDSESENCCSGLCAECSTRVPSAVLLDTQGVDEDDDITWNIWKRINKKVTLQKITGSISSLLDEIDERWSKFLLHTFTNRQQRRYVQELRDQSRPDDFIVAQLDFAENYRFIRQREPQAAHWNTNQATLFTATLKDWYDTSMPGLHK